jgi:hypothetical protein
MRKILNQETSNEGYTVKGKAIPVRDPEGQEGCETLMLPHFLHNRLTDGGHSAAESIRSIEKSNDLIRNQTQDLLASSIVFIRIVPQPTVLPHAPGVILYLV